MTETIETNADTSMEVETQQEPTTDVDTSNNDVVNDSEPAETQNVEEPVEEVTEGKYKTLDQANKAYADLEKKLGEQSAELGELRKMRDEYNAEKEQKQAEALQNAQNNGFNSVVEYENHTELVNFVADEFEKNIAECSYPEEVKNLIDQYRITPNKEILKTIKNEFDVDTVENIALASKEKENELQQRVYDEVKASASEYLNNSVNKYADRFNNPAFAELYGEAFRAYGVRLDTDKFVNLMDSYENFIIKSAGLNKGIANDNINATDEIAGLTNAGRNTQNASERDILSMSDAEMRREILSKI